MISQSEGLRATTLSTGFSKVISRPVISVTVKEVSGAGSSVAVGAGASVVFAGASVAFAGASVAFAGASVAACAAAGASVVSAFLAQPKDRSSSAAIRIARVFLSFMFPFSFLCIR